MNLGRVIQDNSKPLQVKPFRDMGFLNDGYFLQLELFYETLPSM